MGRTAAIVLVLNAGGFVHDEQAHGAVAADGGLGAGQGDDAGAVLKGEGERRFGLAGNRAAEGLVHGADLLEQLAGLALRRAQQEDEGAGLVHGHVDGLVAQVTHLPDWRASS